MLRPGPRLLCFAILLLIASVALTLPARLLPSDRAHAASSLPTTCSAPLVLNLQPGENHADGSGAGYVAPDIPLDPVTIALPLYPGATPGTQPVPNLEYADTFSFYEKTAASEFALPTDVLTAIAWYRKAMAACGYVSAGESLSSGSAGSADTLIFASPTIPSARIELSFGDAQPSTGKTALLLASALVLSAPPRPSASELTGTYRQVDVTYTTAGINPAGKPLHLHLSVHKRTWIAELVGAVNGPQEIEAVTHSCGGRDFTVTLVFHPARGKSIAAQLQCGDLQIGNYPLLVDPYNEVLLTVQKIILASCSTKACRELG